MKFDFVSNLERIGEAQLNAAMGQQMLYRAINAEIYKLYQRGRRWAKNKFERPKPYKNPWA